MCFPLTVSGIIRICWDQWWRLGSLVRNSFELPSLSGWVWPGSPQGSAAFSTESFFSFHIPCTPGLGGREGDLFAPKKHFQAIVPPLLKQMSALLKYMFMCPQLLPSEVTYFPPVTLSSKKLAHVSCLFSFSIQQLSQFLMASVRIEVSFITWAHKFLDF